MTMMKRMVTAGALMIALVFTSGMGRAWAQESGSSESGSSTKAVEKEAPKPVEVFRLDFSISELEDGKKINTRQYSMNLSRSQPQEIRIGTKVPVETKQGEFQYLDIGTNISGRLQGHNDQLELFAHARMSSFAIPEQAQGQDAHSLIRQLEIGGSTLVVLGKPVLIGSADDPNSKRQFQFEVTMTKLH